MLGPKHMRVPPPPSGHLLGSLFSGTEDFSGHGKGLLALVCGV